MEGQQMKNLHINNEMSLFDVLQLLWQQKKLILGAILLSCAASGLYLFLSTPVYEAKVIITAPTTGDISPLNVGRSYAKYSPIKAFDYLDVYRLSSLSLLSNSTKQLFFKQIYSPLIGKKSAKTSESRVYASYLKNITIKTDFMSQPNQYTLLARNEDPLIATELVQQYVSLVNKETMKKLLQQINNQNKSYAEDLQIKINRIQNALIHNQEEQAHKIQSIIQTAKSAGIQNPVLSVNNSDNLETKLHQLEYDYNYYKNKVSIPIDSVKMFHMDGSIMTPQTPISPKKYLVIATGLLVGLLLGSFMAITRALPLRNKK